MFLPFTPSIKAEAIADYFDVDQPVNFMNIVVPVLLNTSFNIHEPIVCTPREAIRTFKASRVDALAIGDYFVTRDLLPTVMAEPTAARKAGLPAPMVPDRTPALFS